MFPASLLDAQHLRDSVESKPASLLVVPLGKAFSGIPHLGVVDSWPATPERARYSALIVFEKKIVEPVNLNAGLSL